MTAADFRKIALSLEGVEEYAHAGVPAFRVGGRKFASLASQAAGYGNLMLSLAQPGAFVEEELATKRPAAKVISDRRIAGERRGLLESADRAGTNRAAERDRGSTRKGAREI